jgi:hypothetical protein
MIGAGESRANFAASYANRGGERSKNRHRARRKILRRINFTRVAASGVQVRGRKKFCGAGVF